MAVSGTKWYGNERFLLSSHGPSSARSGTGPEVLASFVAGTLPVVSPSNHVCRQRFTAHGVCLLLGEAIEMWRHEVPSSADGKTRRERAAEARHQ